MNNNCSVENNALDYADNIKAYQKYVSFIAYLVKTLSLPNNAISSSIILSNLINKGIFSCNGKFIYKDEEKDILSNYSGLNIINGIGNSEQIGKFQNDVLNELYLYCDVISSTFFIDINEVIRKVIPNYYINLIKYNNSVYGYDANRRKLLGIDADKLSFFPIFDEEIIYYQYLYDKDSDCSRKNDTSLLDNLKNNAIISASEYKYICFMARGELLRNEDLFKDFHESSKKYIKEITRGLR